MKARLDAAEVAELAELLEDAAFRIGVVDQVLEAAGEDRGMTLYLRSARPRPTSAPTAKRSTGPAERSRRGSAGT